MGAINESIGGVGIAAPLDSAGAMYTNPATLSALPDNEVSLGIGMLMPDSSVTSEIRGNPATHGYRKSDRENYYCPSFSSSFHVGKNSAWTLGFAAAATGGASAKYATTGSPLLNPILQGRERDSKVKVIQLFPTISYAVTDNFSVGASAAFGIFSLYLNPMSFGLPAATPLNKSSEDYTFGIGFNVGAYYDFKNNIKVGLCVKTPVWADTFEFSGADSQTGLHRKVNFDFNLPLILGAGIAYDGIDRLLIGLDVRYFDYAHTAGFKRVTDNSGNIAGLGWDSVFSVSIGAQYAVLDSLKIRAGYCFSENPIPGKVQYANVASPLFIQHVASIGLTYSFSTGTDISAAWSHAFKNKCSGSFANGAGRVKNTVNAETFFLAVTQHF
jgi:long-chain fatty acid transport protein